MIRRVPEAEATHVESVPVTETFEGNTVWDGSREDMPRSAVTANNMVLASGYSRFLTAALRDSE
jgi:hypothetical protein